MITGLIVGSIISGLVSAMIGGATSIYNANKQAEINRENIANQTAINQANIDASKEFAQNQIQWKVDDLQAAGLNPVLAAGGIGGSSAPTAMQSVQQKAPLIDASGVASAINALNNTMLTSYLLDKRNDVMQDRNDALRALYRNKSVFFDSATQNPYVGNAKQVMSATDNEAWDKIMKELNDMSFKYNFKK